MQSQKHKNSLPRSEKLRGERRVDALFGSGQSGFVYPLRYVWQQAPAAADAPAGAPVCVLVSAPKRNFKRAVHRNCLKRRTREAYRLNKSPLVEAAAAHGGHLRLALVYSAKRIEDYAAIEDALRKIISRVCTSL